MIKIFGRQLFFKFHHLIYKYEVKEEHECNLLYEKITDNLSEVDIGYFSLRMLKKILDKNPVNAECYKFISQKDDKVIGFALLTYREGKDIHYRVKKTDAFITALGVFESCRGKGYSQEILNGIVNVCLDKKYKSLTLSVDSDNIVAKNAYEKFGFKLCDEKKFIRIASVDFLINKNV